MAVRFVHLDDRPVPLSFAPGQVELAAEADLAPLGALVAQHRGSGVEVTLGLTPADLNRLVLAPLPDVPADAESQGVALRQRRYEAVVSRLGLSGEQVILAIGETASQGRIVARR
ncbi:MAG: hypothetical protein HC918_06685 [Oscillatoriales cyanobacterium SM2_1_8]|nr:hypothetical protein [Oscillatoriales cyanobacterium SM2_1_8]